MSNPQIDFCIEEIDFSLTAESSLKPWLLKIAGMEGYEISELTYIFCSDQYLLEINREYLDHDYLTDIITFDNSFDEDPILIGDVFISIDRVQENAKDYDTSFENELHRVMAHGLLHLCGYGDKSEEEQKVMRQKEDTCISLLLD